MSELRRRSTGRRNEAESPRACRHPGLRSQRGLVAGRAPKQMIASLLALVAMAGAGGFSQTGQSAAPLPAVASAQSSPPPFQPLRYEEDWSYLKDESKRSEWIDNMKDIPVNRRCWYVQVGDECGML